jgi:hypothetical protein
VADKKKTEQEPAERQGREASETYPESLAREIERRIGDINPMGQNAPLIRTLSEAVAYLLRRGE